MSSDLESTLEALRTNDYVSFVIITAVLYDYVLTFSREVHYVWHRPWTWISTMFVLVRYFGLSWMILYNLVATTFIPGPVKLCTAIYLVAAWDAEIFLAVADLVMILRVYAMWNQSKQILYFLLFIYVPQVMVSFIVTGIYYNPNTHFQDTIVQVLDHTFCNASFINVPPSIYLFDAGLRFFLSATLLTLAVIPTLKQSVEMYKATKQWQPNKYMQQLVRDGILYFLVNLPFDTFLVIRSSLEVNINASLFLSACCYTTLCAMMPRFIIGVRELYDRDLRDRWQGVDTGFGVLSQPIAGENAVVSAIAFADITPGQSQGQVTEGDEDDPGTIRLEVLGNGTRRTAEGDGDKSEATRLEARRDVTCRV